jgi:hypothetical protein
MQPLSHHEIFELVEPFTRHGRHVDLAASNRLERCLVFKPVEHELELHGVPGLPSPAVLHETLRLANPEEGLFRLTRTLRLGIGLQADLHADLDAEGPDAGELLQRIAAVAPQRQFNAGPGFIAALSFRFDTQAPKAAASNPRMIMTDAVAQVAGCTLTMKVPRVSSMSGEFELSATAGRTVAAPEDLIAVIGWDWSPLSRYKEVWRSKVRLRGKESRRSASAEAKLERTLRHLVQTMSEPPATFHERFVGARWGVAFRRGIPLLTVFACFGAVALLPRIQLDEASVLRMLMFHLPTLLLAVAFSLQEMPRFEIPPWPRRLKAATWFEPAALPDVPRAAAAAAAVDHAVGAEAGDPQRHPG